MNQPAMGQSCQTKCWAAAAVIGVLIMILGLASGNQGWGTSIFLGVLAAVLLGFLMTWLMCSDVPKLGQSARAKSAARGAGTAGTAGAGMGAPAASGTPRSAEPGGPASSVAGSRPETAQPAPAKTAEAAPAKTAEAAPAKTAETAPAAPAEPKAETAAAPAEPAAAKDGGEGSGDSAVKPSRPLPGQAELTSRKGSYKYEGGSEKAPARKAAATKKTATKKTATKKAGTSEPEAETEGTRPEVLDAPRDGGADDLKKIKGIGPKLEKLCNSMGFYHFDQIASWTPEEVAWVDANLEGFRGRVTRDEWVQQAKLLASGGETEFSRRVDKGGVY